MQHADAATGSTTNPCLHSTVWCGTDRYSEDFAPADSRAVTKPAWAEGNQAGIDQLWEKLQTLEAAAASRGRSLLAHTLVESLGTVGITSLILGASRLEQVEQAVAALVGGTAAKL